MPSMVAMMSDMRAELTLTSAIVATAASTELPPLWAIVTVSTAIRFASSISACACELLPLIRATLVALVRNASAASTVCAASC